MERKDSTMRDTTSDDEVKSHEKGVEDGEGGSDGDSDCEFESEYEPANFICRALTEVFSQIQSNFREPDRITEDLQNCAKAASGEEKETLEKVERENDGKEETISASEEGLLRARSGEQKAAKVERVSKPTKERVQHMTEMTKSTTDPCVGRREFVSNDSFLCHKVTKKKLKEDNSKPSCSFHGDTMPKKFEDKSILYSSDLSKGTKKTVKAHYGMKEDFSSDVTGLSEQVKQEQKSDITDEEWQTLDSFSREKVNVKETVQSGKEFQDYAFWKNVEKFPVPQFTLEQIPAETMFVTDMKKRAGSCDPWDYSRIALGGGAAVLVLFAVYRCFR